MAASPESDSSTRWPGLQTPEIAKARASVLRWIQRWRAPGTELRMRLEDAVIDYDPVQFLRVLATCEHELAPVDLTVGRQLGTRWARLAGIGTDRGPSSDG